MAKSGKVKYVNAAIKVDNMPNLRQSIKVEIEGGDLIAIWGDVGSFEHVAVGSNVWIRKNGKNWELCKEGEEDVVAKPTGGKWQGNGYAPAPKPERTLEELKKRGHDHITLFLSIMVEVKAELENSGMTGLPDGVILSTSVHIYNGTIA